MATISPLCECVRVCRGQRREEAIDVNSALDGVSDFAIGNHGEVVEYADGSELSGLEPTMATP
jgi:hypothetical protein